MSATDTVSPSDVEIIEATGKLGKNQKSCFQSLCEAAKGWPGGWVWDNYSGTERMMEAFVKRGLAIVTDPRGRDPRAASSNSGRHYSPTAAAKSFHLRVTALRDARLDAERLQLEAERREDERRSGKRWLDLREFIDGRRSRLVELAQADGMIGDEAVTEAFGALEIASVALRRVRERVRRKAEEALQAAEADKS